MGLPQGVDPGADRGDQAFASAEAGDAGLAPDGEAVDDAAEAKPAPRKKLARWVVISVAVLLYLVALGGGAYGIITGYIKAAKNAKYPATRSSTFTIGPDGESETYPGFGGIVCPLPGYAMVDVTQMTKVEALAWYEQALSVGGSGGASAAFITATVRVTGGGYVASNFTGPGSVAGANFSAYVAEACLRGGVNASTVTVTRAVPDGAAIELTTQFSVATLPERDVLLTPGVFISLFANTATTTLLRNATLLVTAAPELTASSTESSSDWYWTLNSKVGASSDDNTDGMFSSDGTGNSTVHSAQLSAWVSGELVFFGCAAPPSAAAITSSMISLLCTSASSPYINITKQNGGGAPSTAAPHTAACRDMFNGPRLRVAPTPESAKANTYSIAVQTNMVLGHKAALAMLDGGRAALASPLGCTGATVASAFVASFQPSGRDYERYASTIPLFGHIENPASCMLVDFGYGRFDPTLRDTYIDMTDTSVGYANAEVLLRVTVPSGVPVLIALYEKSRGLSSLGSFAVFDTSAGLLNFPRVSTELTKTLKPWRGTTKQIQASFQGSSSSIDSELYEYAWDVSLATAEAVGSRLTTTFTTGPGRQVVMDQFLVNLQPYFFEWDVTMQEEYYSYDFGDAVTQMFTYLNAAKIVIAWAAATGAWLPVVVAAMVVTCTALKRRDFTTVKSEVSSTVLYVKNKHTELTESDSTVSASTTREAALTAQAIA